jgi:isocitrate lyase
MTAYARMQDREFELAKKAGYGAVTHQKFVGTGWFDALQEVISGGKSSTTALGDSTEKHQF